MTKRIALGLAALVAGTVGMIGCTNDEAADGSGGGAGSAGTSSGSGGAGRGGSNTGGAGRGGSAGAAAAPGSGGAQAGSGQGGESSGGANCSGDEALWAEITAGPIACDDNSDCCVVVDFCKAAAQIVHADDYATAGALWPSCDDDECYDCLPPVVHVACVDGTCSGETDEDSLDEGTSHCGTNDEIVSSPSGSGSFTCGG